MLGSLTYKISSFLTFIEVPFITMMSFLFQAPTSMKSVLQSFWLLTVAFGDLIVVILASVLPAMGVVSYASHQTDCKCLLSVRWGGLMVSALNSGSSGPGSSPGWRHCVVFLGKTLYSHSASARPGV